MGIELVLNSESILSAFTPNVVRDAKAVAFNTNLTLLEKAFIRSEFDIRIMMHHVMLVPIWVHVVLGALLTLGIARALPHTVRELEIARMNPMRMTIFPNDIIDVRVIPKFVTAQFLSGIVIPSQFVSLRACHVLVRVIPTEILHQMIGRFDVFFVTLFRSMDTII